MEPGIRTARYVIGMKLAMRIVQWLEQPASAFIYAAKWSFSEGASLLLRQRQLVV